MAFKMKGSAFKLGNIATKSTLKMKSPLEHEGRIVYDEEGREKPPYNLGEEIGEIVGKQTPTLPMKSPIKQWLYDCPDCGLDFETFPELASHISSAHLGGGDPTPGPDRTIEFGPVTPGSGGGGDDDDDDDKKL